VCMRLLEHGVLFFTDSKAQVWHDGTFNLESRRCFCASLHTSRRPA
jgi:hypothetical protein